jgi:hypothetical protein
MNILTVLAFLSFLTTGAVKTNEAVGTNGTIWIPAKLVRE